ncbi:fused MFS/spermidine synthase [Pseudocolwellia agarivorans]|uniref:fused MFS/spermidine synthase n=1 Tax=Pseudocolwellia agarivorans TaxID=1911682 RepID=UPI000986A78E|nr:fused MFS/spermidine synthase [Pseudocolwellia agarivorans]
MLYLFIIFLSAFLLFQVQPLIAKLILPLFGGGAAIWTACLLFFQAFLLLGYLYAHILSKCRSLSIQVSIHAVALFTSLFFMPIGLKQLSEFNQLAPLSDILQLLVLSIGVPYFLLSSTGPLVQKWLSYVYATKADFTPYKLYSLSNIGSLLALLSYPFIFEPLFSLPNQLMYWSAGYILLVVLLIAFCVQLFRLVSGVSPLQESSEEADVTHIKAFKLDWLLWLALSAVGVILLVSITNAMTQNIPPVPFLWILPLSLYLLTFIISFHSPKWYVRWYWYILFVLSSFAGLLMFFIGSQFDILSQVLIYSGILLSSCMICHGELVKLKPSTDRLTLFYLNMSLGGFLGSAFVAFVAQRFFTQFLEFPIALVAVFILLGLCTYILKSFSNNKAEKFTTLIASSCGVFAILLVVGFVSLNQQFKENTVELSRNFYGILSVKDVEVNGIVERRLIDGTTSHGTQSQNENLAHIPMSYYRENTGVALALQHLFLTPTMNVGLVGLGAGTLATYGRRGDNYTFYELNPNVERMARQYFTYIEQSRANVEVVLGDGRVTLQKELDNGTINNFDVLVIDAFSGDSVPAHLLTTEAFELYFKHLKADGVLAIHVSNSHLDLTALVKGLAKNSNYSALYFKTKATEKEVTQTEWVVVTNNKSFIRNTKVKRLQSQWPNANELVWTDNYSNLLSVLK